MKCKLNQKRHFFTKDHLEFIENPDGTLAVRITEVGDDLMNGICHCEFDEQSSQLEIEGQKTSMVIDVPIKGCATFLPPDFREKIYEQFIIQYANGWVMTDDAEFMTADEYDNYVKECR